MSSKKKEPVSGQDKNTGAAAQPEEVRTAVDDAAEAAPVPSETDVLKAGLAAEKDKYLRLLAEYDNYRKRSAKEREAIFADIRSDTITKFLPVYDNLERALRQETADEAFRKGVEMIMAQFNEVCRGLGVSEIEALGKPFDPAVHNAVMHVEDENAEANVIVEEFQKGFMLGGKVIRFSMVKVAN